MLGSCFNYQQPCLIPAAVSSSLVRLPTYSQPTLSVRPCFVIPLWMIQWLTVFYSRLSSWKCASLRHSPCVCRSSHSDAAIDDKNPPPSSEVQDLSASAWYLVSTCARRSPSVCLLRDGSLLFVKGWWCSEGSLPPPTPLPPQEAW